MLLLAPAAAITAALITLPALIVLYLLKLRRRPVRVSTAMFWQKAEQDLQANVPLRWIRPSALFLLHLLILAALVLALGRPALKSGGMARERVVILLDCSASMSATDMPRGESRLAAAKAKAVAAINDLSRVGASGCVVAFAHEASVLAPMTTSRRVLMEAVANAAPTDQPADLAAALALVESIARPAAGESSETGTPASVLLLSDGGFAAAGELRARGVRVRLEHIGLTPIDPADASLVEQGPHNNVGIVVLAARRDPDDPGTVRLFARLLNASDKDASLPATLSLDGRVVERRAVTVPARTPAAVGELPITFEFLSPRGGLVMLTLGGEDALVADNQAALLLSPPVQPAILVAHRHSNANDPKRESRATALALLRDALTELRPRTLRVVDEAQLGTIFGTGEWRAYDLFVGLDAVPPVPMPIASLTFGAVPRLTGLTSDEGPATGVSAGPQGVLQWERNHPLLRSVPLDTLLISRAATLRATRSAERGEEATTLARGRDGPLIVLEREGTVRHVAVAFAIEDSNWSLQVSFPLFLANAVDYLTLRGESAVGRAWTTSESITIPVAESASRAKISLEGPTSIEIDPASAVDGKLTLGALPRAGVYLAAGNRGVPPVAVNLLDANESSLIERATLDVGSAEAMTIADKSPREVWPWFVLVAGALLAVEWVVYGLQMRV